MGWVLRQADRVEPHRCMPPRISSTQFWSSPDGQVGDVWDTWPDDFDDRSDFLDGDYDW